MKRLIIALTVIGILFSACSPAGSTEIVGVWELVSFGDPTFQSPATSGVDISIEFKSDGTLGGNVGCNGFGGDYHVDDGVIEFGPMVSTLMFCEAVAEQESAVLAVFFETASFVLNGGALTVTSADDSAMIVLKRK